MSNLKNLQYAYQVWNDEKGRNTACWEEIFSDRVRLHSVDESSPAMEFAKDRSSKAEAVEYLTAILKDWEMQHWTPHTFVEEGNRIAMFGRCAWKSKHTGKVADIDIAHLMEFEGGRIVGLSEVFDSAKAMAAALPD